MPAGEAVAQLPGRGVGGDPKLFHKERVSRAVKGVWSGSESLI